MFCAHTFLFPTVITHLSLLCTRCVEILVVSRALYQLFTVKRREWNYFCDEKTKSACKRVLAFSTFYILSNSTTYCCCCLYHCYYCFCCTVLFLRLSLSWMLCFGFRANTKMQVSWIYLCSIFVIIFYSCVDIYLFFAALVHFHSKLKQTKKLFVCVYIHTYKYTCSSWVVCITNKRRRKKCQQQHLRFTSWVVQ